MKTRNGFVSNSSSSSFIINVGVVQDRAKFDKFRQDVGIAFNDGEFYESQKDLNTGDYAWNVFDEGDWAGNYFDRKDMIDLLEKHPDKLIYVKTGYGGHSDNDFWNGYDMCYDNLDLDEMPPEDVKLFNSDLEDSGIEIVYQHYGAGRDG